MNILLTDNPIKAERRLKVFLMLWFVLSYLQGVFSGLNEDEPYYYMYAMFPDWGYFDHPPMVGMFILGGITVAGKMLGMRLFSAISSTLFLLVVWKLIRSKDKYRYVNVFILLALAIPMVSVYGFIIVPDAPLLFFASIFLLCYKQFLDKENIYKAIALGLVGALMIYSKYHGVLLIFFIILSNVKLLRSKYFWLSAVICVVALTPHIMWQVVNDFPSMRYHLYERSADHYQLRYTLEYPLNQLAVFGPFLLPLMLIAICKNKSKDSFDRGMRFVFWGFLGFFWLMSFKGHVEPHWTVIAIIPAMIFTFEFVKNQSRYSKYFLIGSISTAVLLLVARVLLFIPNLPTPYHNQTQWADTIANTAQGAPVVFKDTYQLPSMYTYYTNGTAISLNTPAYRRNQYDLWSIKDNLKGKRVLYLDGVSSEVIIKGRDFIYKGRWIDNFDPERELRNYPKK